MRQSQAAIVIGILVIAVVLGSLWFFGRNFEAPEVRVGPEVVKEASLPEGWGIFVANGLTIAHPGTPWVVVAEEEGAVFAIEKPGEALPLAMISFSVLPIETSFEELILEDVTYSPSGNKPEDITDFDLLVVGGRTWYVTQVELFEAVSVRSHYLKRSETEVIKAELLESEVADWTDPEFKPGNTESARTLEDMITFLGT